MLSRESLVQSDGIGTDAEARLGRRHREPHDVEAREAQLPLEIRAGERPAAVPPRGTPGQVQGQVEVEPLDLRDTLRPGEAQVVQANAAADGPLFLRQRAAQFCAE